MSPYFNEMSELAGTYCELIETVAEADPSWLKEMAQLLPRLHAAVSALGTPKGCLDHSMLPDLDARFELYVQLRKFLGTKDAYWMEFDVAHDSQFMTGSLADDLTDIYCELKHGLDLLEREPGRAFDDWRQGYRVHWGQHLIDAEKHLYELGTRDQL